MTQYGSSDHRTPLPEAGVVERVSDGAQHVSGRAVGIVEDLGGAIQSRPYTSLMVAVGVAFAVGAIWKLGHRREATRLDRLLAQFPELPDRRSLERWWR